MSSDIITSLQLDKECESSRVLVAKEINSCDSSFIISCVLGHCIKNKNAVLLVSTHNSLSHYQNIGLKMNYNLQKYIDSGLVYFYNLGKENVSNLLDDKCNTLQDLFSTVKEKMTMMKEKHNSVNMILDGISHLFDLQYNLRDVNYFCREIIKLIRLQERTFVLFHCNVASEEDITHVIANLLSHMAHTVLEVESLSSGWSADVSGHLLIKHPAQKFEDDHIFQMDVKSSRYLFKLFDRGVKLFAPGTV